AYMARDGLPGPIYVFGNPLYMLLSDRAQAIPMNGWSLEFATAQQWSDVAATLDLAKPPYIYMDNETDPLVRRKIPDTVRWLESAYAPALKDVTGTLYRRKAPD